MKMKIGLALAALLMASTGWGQTSFNKYGPVAGIQKNAGNTPYDTAAVAADVTGLYTGCTGLSTQYLAANNTCQTSSSGVTSANPSATIGLAAVNGTAPTFMTSDSAPPLSQAITPTWSGLHTFARASPTQGILLKDTAAGTDAKTTNLVSTGGFFSVTGVSDAGTNGTNLMVGTKTGSGWSALSFGNATDNTAISFLGTGQFSVAGGVVLGSPTGGNKGAGTINVTGCFINNVACATGGAPGGANTQVQYNASGVFGANSGFTYDGSGSIALTGNVVATGTNHLFGATTAQTFGTTISARTDGSHYAMHQSTDANGNQICFGLNASGSTNCNIPTGNFGVGYNTILPFAIYRNGVSQLGFTTAGAASFVGSVTANGANASYIANGTSGVSMVKLQNSGADKGYLCLSLGAGACTVGDATNDLSLRTDGVTYFSTATGGNAFASLTQAGVFNVKTGGDVVIGAVSVCRSDGTNCPAAPSTGSYTATTTGCTTAPTVTVTWTKLSNTVTLFIPSISCTSNASTFTLTGGSGGMLPSVTVGVASPFCLDSGTSNTVCAIEVAATGTLTFDKLFNTTYSNSAWTATGSKGGGPWTITYKSL